MPVLDLPELRDDIAEPCWASVWALMCWPTDETRRVHTGATWIVDWATRPRPDQPSLDVLGDVFAPLGGFRLVSYLANTAPSLERVAAAGEAASRHGLVAGMTAAHLWSLEHHHADDLAGLAAPSLDVAKGAAMRLYPGTVGDGGDLSGSAERAWKDFRSVAHLWGALWTRWHNATHPSRHPAGPAAEAAADFVRLLRLDTAAGLAALLADAQAFYQRLAGRKGKKWAMGDRAWRVTVAGEALAPSGLSPPPLPRKALS